MPRPKRQKVQTARAAQRVALQPKTTNPIAPTTGVERDGKKQRPAKAKDNTVRKGRVASTQASQSQTEPSSPKPLSRGKQQSDDVQSPSSSVSFPVAAPGSIIRDQDTNVVSKVTDSFPALQPSAPPSVARIQATPSMISLSNFKRRPRQPSILQLVQQRLALDGQDEVEDASLLALGGPLTSSPTQDGQSDQDSPVQARTLSSRKRKHSNVEDSKSPASHTPAPKARRVSSNTGSDSTSESNAANTVQVPSSQPQRASTRQSMAAHAARAYSPPRAVESSPIAQSVEPKTPPRRRQVNKAQLHAPLPVSNHIESMSPESTPSTSPAKQNPPRRTRTQQPTLQTSTTSKLQELLPKRRKRRRFKTDEFEILDDEVNAQVRNRGYAEVSEGEDGDELHRPATRRARETGTKSKTKKPKRGGPKPLAKQTDPKENKLRSKPKRLSKVYGKSQGDNQQADRNEDSIFSPSRAGEDELDDSLLTSESMVEAREALKKAKGSNELKDAAEKFKSVDEWELSFESQDMGGESSSPWR